MNMRGIGSVLSSQSSRKHCRSIVRRLRIKYSIGHRIKPRVEPGIDQQDRPQYKQQNQQQNQQRARVSMGQRVAIALSSMLLLASCQRATSEPQPRNLQIQQTWELQPGQSIAGYAVAAGLGDITVRLDGGSVYAPYEGDVQPAATGDCVIYSSAEVPAYVFRLCGLRQPQLGQVRAGQPIGTGVYLHFAALRRQPDGTWVIVEPASQIVEQMLTS